MSNGSLRQASLGEILSSSLKVYLNSNDLFLYKNQALSLSLKDCLNFVQSIFLVSFIYGLILKLVPLLQGLLSEIQDEIVASLMPTINPSFRRTAPKVPLDAAAQSRLAVILAQLKNRFNVRFVQSHSGFISVTYLYRATHLHLSLK